MIGHRLLSDADLAGSRPVSAAELETAIANVVAMSCDDFYIAARGVGLDPWNGMNRRAWPLSEALLDRLDADAVNGRL